MASPYPAYDGRPQNTTNAAPYSSPQYSHQGSTDSDISQSVTVPALSRQRRDDAIGVNARQVSRTPSPTPSEAEELKKTGLFDWKAMSNRKYWFRREWLWYYVAFVIIFVITILFTVLHKQIVSALQPSADKLKDLPGGWAIPIGIFIIISFPPLFGHEILAILCGLVWGLGIGFGIVAAGTFLGEVANFYAFRYCCSARGEKLEKTKLQYGCLAKVVREGGFKIALIARFSAIPGHFTTAVFSTCGMSIWTFAIAAILSLPKQFLTVYLGVALEDSESGQSSTKDTIIRDIVIVLTTVVTFVAMWYIYRLMNRAKPQVIYERRKARQAKMAMDIDPYGSSNHFDSPSSVSNTRKSESELPLTASFQAPGFQQWDSQGRAVGYAPDPMLYAPQPQRPVKIAPAPVSTSSTPAMSERMDGRAQPIRANTGGSASSWDVQSQAGPNAYPMSLQSGQADLSSTLPRIPPPSGPATAAATSSHYSPQAQLQTQPRMSQTPTQTEFPYPGDAARSTTASPHTMTAQYPTQQQPAAYPPGSNLPPPLPSGQHYAQPTDSSYYAAYSNHPQQPTHASNDPYTAYRQ